MHIMNTTKKFGIITKFLHWSIAGLVFLQFALAYWVIYVLPEKSPLAGFLIGSLHKPLGILLLILALLAIIWKLINTRPIFPINMLAWEKTLAKLVHGLLYLCLIIMPISGIIMSITGGRPPNFFGLFQFPMLMAENKELSNFFFIIHQFTSFFLLGLICLHILAALKHHFINKDEVLKRML